MSSDTPPVEYSGWKLIVFVSLFIPFEIAIFALRWYARALRKAQYDLGDILMAAALFSQLVASALGLGTVIQGDAGYHVSYVEATHPERITVYFKYVVAIALWYAATVNLAKMAVCKLYLTVFPHRPVIILVWIIASGLVSASVVLVIVLLLSCRPFSANWDSVQAEDPRCLNRQAIYIWATVPNIASDVLLLAIPLPIIWNLHATIKLKLALSFTFVVGGLGVLTSVLRFNFYLHTNAFIDPTYHGLELIIWTIAEPGMYFTSVSLLVFRPLVDQVNVKLPKFLSRYFSTCQATDAESGATPLDATCNPFDASGDRNFTNITMGTQHRFAQLDGSEAEVNGQNANNRITVVTHIQQSWKNV
ncbi:hypothetical protein F4861DRAFT_511126 [Xylaria intraflava]|nr:hypothetical protein F4861DRAFT_511126 [Xylaria intraflava]